MDNINNYNKEQIKKLGATLFALEYLGIHIENMKQEVDKYGIPSKQIYYFSVPETSTIKLKDKELNNIEIGTSIAMISFAKRELSNMLIESCRDAWGEDEEFIKEVEDNISDYLKFYAKVRAGENWNEELGAKAVKKITDELNAADKYKEV